jgi:branched-chain amino acid aminotransferase
METCLLNYFIVGTELRSTCDFNPNLHKEGRGIYEVFRVINGIPLFLNEHIDRFYNSAVIGGYSININRPQILQMLQRLIEVNHLKNGNIQFQFIERKNVGKHFTAWITPTIYPTKKDYTEGVQIATLNAVRNLPNLKSVNLPTRQKANQFISENEIFEVLLIDDEGLVTEGSRSNIFFVKDNKLITTNLELVLPGITRSKVIEIAFRENIDLHTTLITYQEIEHFEAAFLTSTSMKILPVNQIDNVQFDAGNSLVNRMKLLYDQDIERQMAANRKYPAGSQHPGTSLPA